MDTTGTKQEDLVLRKKKMSMYRTFKTAIFGKVTNEKNHEVPAVKVIDGHLCVNDECCDLRTIRERYDLETKELTPSVVENILSAESFITKLYGKRTGGQNTMYDFITVDCSGANDLRHSIPSRRLSQNSGGGRIGKTAAACFTFGI